MNTPLFTPEQRAEWERRKADWGESGPSFAIAQDRVFDFINRAVIALNARGHVPKNSVEQQKKRTFVDPK